MTNDKWYSFTFPLTTVNVFPFSYSQQLLKCH